MNKRGFTLVEVLIALIILTVVSLSLGRFVASFSHAVGTSTIRTIAIDVATEQMELVRGNANPTAYPTLVANFNGNVVTGFPSYPRMTRTTTVVRTTGTNPRRDYTTITVTVTEPTLGAPIDLTAVVAAP
jgi:prepilin-type N-terminal cleavage/methylation domain-containing protein